MTDAAIAGMSMLAGGLAGLLALWAAVWLMRGRETPPRPVLMGTLSEPRRFLFRNGYLVEHSGNVGFLLPEPIDHLRAWDELADALGLMVDGVSGAMDDLRETGRAFRLEGRIGCDCLNVVGMREGDGLRVSVSSAEAAEGSLRVGVEGLHALEAEMALLTASADTSPAASWVEDAEGRVVWANDAYQSVVARCFGPEACRGWPFVALFPEEEGAVPGRTRRQVVDLEGAPLWFEVLPGAPDAAGLRHAHASALDAVVAAEDGLRTFMQTLTKTFAYLPTGLAMFDRSRTLAMFNPALMDMTGLDGAWLSRRPKLEDFFDALRERRRLPEPRDYKTWREGLSDLSRVGATGVYRETWTLPTGQTYCVTVRPQPDGGMALMMEDVSEDVSADRAHRLERDALAGALAACGDAVVVFAADGQRIAANAAAEAALVEATGAPLPATLDASIRLWRDAFLPSPAWGDLRGAARPDAPAPRPVAWTERLRRGDGPDVPMRILPGAAGGLTLAFAFPPDDPVHIDLIDAQVAVPAE